MSLRDVVNDLGTPKTKDGEDPRIEALRLALESSTPERAGTPWEHPSRSQKKEEEPELI